MSTQYKHKVTIAVPESMIPQANHLACLLGEDGTTADFFDRSQAEAAFASLNKPGGLLMAVGVNPHKQFKSLGFRTNTDGGRSL